MSRQNVPVSGVILAGGDSRRMGQDKAFLRVGGQRLIDRVLHVVRRLSDDVIVVTNSPDDYAGLDARLVCDEIQGAGALGGIYTGLLAAGHRNSIVVACDMPFLNEELLRYMVDQIQDHDVVMPYVGEREPAPETRATAKARDLHPLHAVYSKRCLLPIERALERGDLRTIAFLQDVDVCFVGRAEIERFAPHQRSFFNANNPADLQRAREISRTAVAVG